MREVCIYTANLMHENSKKMSQKVSKSNRNEHENESFSPPPTALEKDQFPKNELN